MIPDDALVNCVPFFRYKWTLMMEAGYCDAVGSAEYDRVLTKWLDADAPDCGDFIAEHANRPPDKS